MADPAVDVRAALLGQTLGSVTLSASNTFIGLRREPDGSVITSPAVFIRELGLGDIEPYFGGPGGSDFNTDFLQIAVVSTDINGYQAARTLAYNLIQFLHKRAAAGYSAWLIRNASPQTIEDQDGRPFLVLTLRCTWKEQRST